MGISNDKRRRSKHDKKVVGPEPDVWEAPPKEEWYEDTAEFRLDGGFTILSRDSYHRDYPPYEPVSFALMLFHDDHGDRQLARTDTCHNEVHVHQLHRSKPDDDVGYRKPLEKISSHSDVAEWRWKAYDRMQQDALEHKRKWEYE